jgi:O-antigen biosynthesis protein
MDECEVCGAQGSFARFELREMLFGTRETFDYMRCPSCGVLRIVEIPADMSPYYPPDYYDGPSLQSEPTVTGLAGIADRAKREVALFGRGRRRARLLRRWASSPAPTKDQRLRIRRLGLSSFDDPVLDVGCGHRPVHLLALQRLGFGNLEGIDPFLDADVTVEGIRLRKIGIGEVEGTFQTITFHHSFEHVADPRATLAAAEARLRPGGVVLIRTPVFGTWFWDRFGTAWWELDPPRHLFVHTRASLARLAEEMGLEIFHVEWDSSYVELIASTQIAHDVAWREPASWHTNPPAGFDDPMIERLKSQAAALNEAGDAGRAGFYLRRPGDPNVGAARSAPAKAPAATKPVAQGGEQLASVNSGTTSDDGVRELIRMLARPSQMAQLRLNLVIPTLDVAAAFGGVRTAIDLFRAVATDGTPSRIISLESIDPAGVEAFPGARLVTPDEDVPDPVQVVAIKAQDHASLPVGPRDVFIATYWTTADLVIRIRQWQQANYGAVPPRFVYLIQDFEPGFYPWSAQHLLARATYDQPGSTIAVFNTSLLRDYVHDQGIRFAGEFAFEPRLAPALRLVRDRAPVARDLRIVAYGRPRTPRNAFPLIVDGLRSWRASHAGAADWSVLSVGQEHADINLGGGGVMRSIGKLDIGAYGDLLKRSAVGLSLMVSPHPSYPPLEMAHLGMLVLTNRFGRKDLSTWHENLVSLDQMTAEAIGGGLAAQCRRIELDPLAGEHGLTLRPEFLADGPQFPFAGELMALLRADNA